VGIALLAQPSGRQISLAMIKLPAADSAERVKRDYLFTGALPGPDVTCAADDIPFAGQ
jgi:hypothetical protein